MQLPYIARFTREFVPGVHSRLHLPRKPQQLCHFIQGKHSVFWSTGDFWLQHHNYTQYSVSSSSLCSNPPNCGQKWYAIKIFFSYVYFKLDLSFIIASKLLLIIPNDFVCIFSRRNLIVLIDYISSWSAFPPASSPTATQLGDSIFSRIYRLY